MVWEKTNGEGKTTKQQGWYLIGVLSLYFAYCIHPAGEQVLVFVFALMASLAFGLGVMDIFDR